MALNWFKKNKGSEDSLLPDKDKTAPPPPAAPPSRGVIQRLKDGLSRTRQVLNTDIDKLFVGKRQIDDELLEELEEILITADIGVKTATDLIQRISAKFSSEKLDSDGFKKFLKQEILELLNVTVAVPVAVSRPLVIMVIGVNGVGKTTTIGKLAARFVHDGKKVLIAAADTFRAAAVEQLAIWAERSGAEIVRHKPNADPAAVAFDGVEAAMARDMDVVIVDTAGRLHTRVNLMEELKKIRRSISKKIPDAPHETLLVLDATTGQNAISQARMFHESIGVTALALTKLDGTAKGGIVVSICHDLKLPLKYIGIGESIEDLQLFNSEEFVNAFF
ncbi:MAG: signal recognition particle-docking protein FtsY [Desulfatirhabdiaceae bacterium]|nr:signal recognition particle-docking protein FtsY [Desulfatirhabdiaceae bacterium]